LAALNPPTVRLPSRFEGVTLSKVAAEIQQNELILEIGADGGSIKLLGTRTPNGWRFRRSVLDQTPALLTDEDRGDLLSTIQHESDWVDSWEARAINTFDMDRLIDAVRVST
jgi:hypothetical protein